MRVLISVVSEYMDEKDADKQLIDGWNKLQRTHKRLMTMLSSSDKRKGCNYKITSLSLG